MKILIFLTVLLSVAFTNAHTQELLSLQDRLKTYLFIQESKPLLEKSKAYEQKGVLNEELSRLSSDKQKEVNEFIQSAQDDLPAEFLLSYLHWREIEKDDQKAIRVLHFAFMYRLLTLRDLIDHPQNDQPQKARELLKNLTNDPQIESDNIFTRANPLMDHLALTIHEKTDLKLVAQALENTPLINQKISLPLYRPYITDPFGFVTGNEISLLARQQDQQKIKELVGSAKTDLTISASLLKEQTDTQALIIEKSKQSDFQIQIIADAGELSFWQEFKAKNLLSDNVQLLIQQEKTQTLADSLLPEFFKNFTAQQQRSQIMIIDSLSKKPMLFITEMTPYKLSQSILIRGPIVTLSKMSLWPQSSLISEEQNQVEAAESSRDPIQLRKNGQLRVATHDGQKGRGEIRSTFVDMISHAQKHIFLQTHFLYDAVIVDALIKRKIQKPDLNIKILIDHNMHYGLGGFPNSLFLWEMKNYGIEIRAHKEITSQKRTMMVVDSAVALLMPEDVALQAFESNSSYQAIQFFSEKDIRVVEDEFESQWSEMHQLFDLNISDFQLPTKGSVLERSRSRLFNDIGTLLIRSRD